MYYDNVLYIIGNGFDMYHGVNSSYSNFKEYVKRHNYSLYQTLNGFFMPHDLWSNFEANLALLSREVPLAAVELLMPDSKKDFNDLSMADIIMPGDFAGGMLDELLRDIRLVFHKWILTLKLPYSHKGPKLWIDHYARFINFNYTKFLQTIYGIDRARINYIHGYYLDKMGSLIVGHGTPHDKLYSNWIDSIKPRYNKVYTNKKGKRYRKRDTTYNAYLNEDYVDPIIDMAVDRIEQYYSDSLKDTKKIIIDNRLFFEELSDIEYIYILGHSVSPVDAEYFKEIISQNNNLGSVKWYVTYYNDDQKNKLKDNLYNMGVSYEQIFLIPWSHIEK